MEHNDTIKINQIQDWMIEHYPNTFYESVTIMYENDMYSHELDSEDLITIKYSDISQGKKIRNILVIRCSVVEPIEPIDWGKVWRTKNDIEEDLYGQE